MNTATFTVTGMTCAHCVRSVTEEVSEIDGVTDVRADLDTGVLRISATTPIDRSAVAAAVTEAGYDLGAP